MNAYFQVHDGLIKISIFIICHVVDECLKDTDKTLFYIWPQYPPDQNEERYCRTSAARLCVSTVLPGMSREQFDRVVKVNQSSLPNPRYNYAIKSNNDLTNVKKGHVGPIEFLSPIFTCTVETKL